VLVFCGVSAKNGRPLLRCENNASGEKVFLSRPAKDLFCKAK
jgi:hypothetical protein